PLLESIPQLLRAHEPLDLAIEAAHIGPIAVPVPPVAAQLLPVAPDLPSVLGFRLRGEEQEQRRDRARRNGRHDPWAFVGFRPHCVGAHRGSSSSGRWGATSSVRERTDAGGEGNYRARAEASSTERRRGWSNRISRTGP